MNLTIKDLEKYFKCKCCGKQMTFNLRQISEYPKTWHYKDGEVHRMPVCSEKCKINYESQYFVEEYHNHKIYCINGRYIPYFGCHYSFSSIEDCKRRIDDSKVGYYGGGYFLGSVRN